VVIYRDISVVAVAAAKDTNWQSARRIWKNRKLKSQRCKVGGFLIYAPDSTRRNISTPSLILTGANGFCGLWPLPSHGKNFSHE